MNPIFVRNKINQIINANRKKKYINATGASNTAVNPNLVIQKQTSMNHQVSGLSPEKRLQGKSAQNLQMIQSPNKRGSGVAGAMNQMSPNAKKQLIDFKEARVAADKTDRSTIEEPRNLPQKGETTPMNHPQEKLKLILNKTNVTSPSIEL